MGIDLQLTDVAVRFGGVRALDRVTFGVDHGSITALVGPNGAGKTTALNAVTGLVPVAHGRIEFLGEEIGSLPIYKRARLGIGRTFQNLRLFEQMSVRENVIVSVAAQRVPTPLHLARASARRSALLARVDEVLERLDLYEVRDNRVGSLPYGVQKLVEIARGLCIGDLLILLDEPGAGLSPSEKDSLSQALIAIRDAGTTVLVIDHDMSFLMAIADWVTVLHQGTVLSQGRPEHVQADPAVVEAYLGTG